MQKILYVEDSPDARRLVQRLLSDRYSVLEAEDGLTGIEMTSAEEPALILIDINIPFLDGYEVATKLKSLQPEVPVVALTADISEGARQRALAAGCDGYISKPIEPDQFPAQIEVFLKGKREVLEQEERDAYAQAYQQKLANRLEEKVRELTIRNQIADIFLTISDEEIYGEVLQVILEATESKCGIFGYIDEDGNLATSVTRDTWDQCQVPDKDNMFPHKTWGGIWGRAMKEKKALYSNEPFHVPEGHIPVLRAMTVPIVCRGKLIGVIAVANKMTDYDEKSQRLLETITGSMAPILHARLQRDRQERERKRAEEALYQETVRRLKETEALGAVTTALTHSLDLDQVLQSIVDSATRLIPASTSGVLHFVDEAAGKLIPQATSAPGANVQKSMEMPVGKGIAGLVMQEKRLINVPNVEEDPRFFPLDTDTPKKSLLTAPLMIDGDCIGTLSLNSDQVDAFSADDERLLTTLAAQATIAVRNARLHQEVQHRVEELVFLNRVGRTVTSSLNLEQILTTVLEETTLVLRTEAGSILLLNEESSELVFEAAVGPRAKGIKGLRFPLGQGIAGWAAREGQRLLVPNAKEDPRFYPGIDGVTSFVTKSVLAVPLKVKGKVIGVIEAVNKIENDFSQADVALLSSIAQPAAIAIENARLYEELQNRMEELKRTQAQLIQSAKLAAIGELAACVAHEINNPLTSIVGFTRLLLQEIDDDAMKEDLQIIDREAARTKAIVRGLLDFARQREPQLEQVDVNEIVQTTMALIRHQAKCARVTIKESYDETLPLVSLDADQIKQVFLNMMTNAIQAMPKGGEFKVVTARRSQAQSPDGSTGSPQRLAKGMDSADYVVVEFHDTGTGISMEDLPRIFDPFFTTKEVGQGTGLGLSISHSIVEKHGGKIKVESKVGRGSTFTVMLPVTEGEG